MIGQSQEVGCNAMIDDLKPYKKYKTSKLSGLGYVPEHWDELRAKYVFREVDERSLTGDEELLSVSHKTGITPRSEKNVTMFLAESNVGHKLCRPGDLAINTMWAWMAALGVSRYTGLVSPSYGVYRRTVSCPSVRDEYLDRLLRTEAYRSEFVVRSTGVNSSRLRLYPEHFLRIPLLIPPAEEQAAIVRYLAHLDYKINRFIRAKKKLITLLNEQKQAIIHRAVTRGINPNVKLKPSGVEWLGNIPEHWELRPLKFIATRSQNGATPPTSEPRYYDVGTIPWYGPSSIGVPTQVGKPVRLLSHTAVDEGKARLIRGPALLVVVIGATAGRMALMSDAGATNQQITAFELATKTIAPEFLVHQIRGAEAQLRSCASTATIPILDAQDVARLPVALPPLNEQEAILRSMSLDIRPFDVAIEQARKEVELLHEYRARVISDVVTGKLDVRDATAKLPDFAPEVEPLDESEELSQDELATEDETEVAEAA
jgi:type I restriction enzyme S subunit